MRSTPWIAETRIGDSTIGELIDQTARFEWRGGALVAGNAAAEAVLAAAPGVRDAIRGAISYAAADGSPQLAGFAFAGSRAADVVQGIASALAGDRWVPPAAPTEGDRELLEEYVRDWSSWIEPDGWSANANGGWVNLGFAISAELARLTTLGTAATAADAKTGASIAQVVSHELQHRITPRAYPFTEEHTWLEEGTAQLLSNAPAGVLAAARAMRLPAAPIAPGRYYADYVGAVRTLLDLAGGGDDRRRALELLQGPAPHLVLPRLATAIVERQGLHGAAAQRLRADILALHDFDGDDGDAAPGLLAAVDRIVATLRTP